MAVTRTPRSSWIEAGLRALAEGGPEAVRVEQLAQSLGVTKGGFYWHFEDRQALLDELLDAWEHAMVDEAIERVESSGGDARARLRRLFELAASGEVRSLLRVDLAVRDWSRRDRQISARLRRVDDRRMEYLRPLFREFCADEDEVEVRCMLVLCVFVGSPFIAVTHGSRSRRQVLERALEQLLR
jgi:AcrR family transcriptional regulator